MYIFYVYTEISLPVAPILPDSNKVKLLSPYFIPHCINRSLQ